MVSKRDFARVLKEPFEMAFSMVNIKKWIQEVRDFPLVS